VVEQIKKIVIRQSLVVSFIAKNAVVSVDKRSFRMACERLQALGDVGRSEKVIGIERDHIIRARHSEGRIASSRQPKVGLLDVTRYRAAQLAQQLKVARIVGPIVDQNGFHFPVGLRADARQGLLQEARRVMAGNDD
jgi:hypothetical protein